MYDGTTHPYTGLYSPSVKVWGICRVSFVKVFTLKHHCWRVFDSFDGYFVAHKGPDIVDPVSGRVNMFSDQEEDGLPDHRGTF